MRQILIVDDSPTIRRMVRASLAPLAASADFIEAGSGLEAIERLALGDAALMVLDLNMPDMHGLEVLAFVRSHQKYRRLPIIVLTTRGDEASRTAAMQAGASVYLTKPFAPALLITEVAALLGDGATVRDSHVASPR
jgi:two-component system, chemotaxis family, chemotaxis protein CheY